MDPADRLNTSIRNERGLTVVHPYGTLDSQTYILLRDTIIKAAIEAALGVVVDLNDLDVPAPSAWAVLTSARWAVSRWLDLPILLMARSSELRNTLRRNGITRYCPCFQDMTQAEAAVTHGVDVRKRARTVLPVDGGSAFCRQFVRETLTRWSLDSYRTTALVVATEVVENALQFGRHEPTFRLEYRPPRLTIAVGDDSPDIPVRRETDHGTTTVSGLGLVTTLASAWGSSPAATGGKVVWAVLGPDAAV
jgi:anti-anti-sigma regulatory factor